MANETLQRDSNHVPVQGGVTSSGEIRNVLVCDDGALLTKSGIVSSVNSSTTVLASSGIFTGDWEDVSEYASIVVSVIADQNGTVAIQFSTNATNTDSTLTHYYKTDVINPPHRYTVTRKYFRAVFTNTSSSTQTYFRLQSSFGNQTQLNIPTDALMAQSFDAIAVRPTDFGLDVARGLLQGITFNNKFGRNTATVTNDAIWSVSTAYTEPATAELCNVKSDDVDDAAGDTGARTISITGIDENYDVVTETVTMNGTTNVLTTNKYLNIHRAYVATAGSNAGAEGTITITSTASGTPVIGNIAFGYNQTQSTVYIVPRYYTAYVNTPKVTMQTSTGGLTMDIGFFKKDFGGVFRIQNDFLLIGSGDNLQVKAFGAPIKFDGKSTILFKCIAASASADISVDYDIWLVRDQA